MKKILTQSLSFSLEKVVPFYMMMEGLSGGVFEQTPMWIKKGLFLYMSRKRKRGRSALALRMELMEHSRTKLIVAGVGWTSSCVTEDSHRHRELDHMHGLNAGLWILLWAKWEAPEKLWRMTRPEFFHHVGCRVIRLRSMNL